MVYGSTLDFGPNAPVKATEERRAYNAEPPQWMVALGEHLAKARAEWDAERVELVDTIERMRAERDAIEQYVRRLLGQPVSGDGSNRSS